jgi:hypothetical protein
VSGTLALGTAAGAFVIDFSEQAKSATPPETGVSIPPEAKDYAYVFVLVDSEEATREVRATDEAPNTRRFILISGTPGYETMGRQMESLFESNVPIEIVDLRRMPQDLEASNESSASELAVVATESGWSGRVRLNLSYLVDSDAEATQIRALPVENGVSRRILVAGTPEFAIGLGDRTQGRMGHSGRSY